MRQHNGDSVGNVTHTNMTFNILLFLLTFITILPSTSAFYVPNHHAFQTISKSHVNTFSSSSTTLIPHSSSSSSPQTALKMVSLPNIEISALVNYFLERLIDYGVPALVSVLVIAFAAKSFRGDKDEMDGDGGFEDDFEKRFGGGSRVGGENAVNDLYDDLYDDSSSPSRSSSPINLFRKFRGPSKSKQLSLKNLGIPSKTYLTITKLNEKFDSYDYSITSTLKSKSFASQQLRSKNFDNALQRAFDSGSLSSSSGLSNSEKSRLLGLEQDVLKRGGKIVGKIGNVQRMLTESTILEGMKDMNVSVGEIDPVVEDSSSAIDAEIESKNVTDDKGEGWNANFFPNRTKASLSEASIKKENLKKLERLNTELVEIELEFIRGVIDVMGPERANGLRVAILGNANGANGAALAGTLLRGLKERPLSSLLFDPSSPSESHSAKKNLFVTNFPGDVTASQVTQLREEVTAIIRSAQPGDEVLLLLQTGGGTVTGYGLAAAQLCRFKENGLKLTVCVEQVAASGGYMMCCVADKIIASPFAVLGSIGVIGEVPNVYERLKREGVEFQTVTAGKFKRTLTPTKKVTKEDIDKQKQDLEDILVLFKSFVQSNRPQLDIDKVATGETWFGTDALDKGLCDEIKTVDDVLVEYVDEGYDVLEVKYTPPKEDGVLALISPAGSVSEGGGWVGSLVKWVVRSVAPILKKEVTEVMVEMDVEGRGIDDVRKRYMAKDPDESSDRIRMQD